MKKYTTPTVDFRLLKVIDVLNASDINDNFGDLGEWVNP